VERVFLGSNASRNLFVRVELRHGQSVSEVDELAAICFQSLIVRKDLCMAAEDPKLVRVRCKPVESHPSESGARGAKQNVNVVAICDLDDFDQRCSLLQLYLRVFEVRVQHPKGRVVPETEEDARPEQDFRPAIAGAQDLAFVEFREFGRRCPDRLAVDRYLTAGELDGSRMRADDVLRLGDADAQEEKGEPGWIGHCAS
jgi:hypothetical protein